jgi:uncharacterized protein
VKVIDNTERSRYELLDGDELIGFSEYHFHRGEMALLHTEIGERYGGRGLGGELVRGALDDARARGLTVLPYCPFVRGWMTKHPEYRDLVPDTHQSMFDTEGA